MKVWMVTADTYNEPYGSYIECFGIYTDKGAAATRLANLPKAYECDINEVEIDTDIRIDLGGYAE